jgi:hypothetical protein
MAAATGGICVNPPLFASVGHAVADDWTPRRGGKLPGFGGTFGQAGGDGRPVNGTDDWSARGFSPTVYLHVASALQMTGARSRCRP